MDNYNQWLVWFDNDKKATFQETLGKARDHFEKKYGGTVVACQVNPKTFTEMAGEVGGGGEELTVLGIRIVGSQYVPVGHYFVALDKWRQ